MLFAPSASTLAMVLLSSSTLASPVGTRWTSPTPSEASPSSSTGGERTGRGTGVVLVGEGAEQNGALGYELVQSPGWVGWLSGLGWGEGELAIVHPNGSSSEMTFPSRAASFTPRLSAPDSDPADSPSNSSSSSSNPLLGRLLPLHLFPNASTTSHRTNISGCPPPSHRSSRATRQPHELFPPADLRLGAPQDGVPGRKMATIALVVRGDCHFSEKVRWAQSLGADAVVVGDQAASKGEPDDVGRTRTGLITMFSPDDTSDLRISAVFVSRSTYLTLRDELALSNLPAPGGIEVRLSEDLGWEWPLLDLLLLLLLLPSLLTLATLGMHHFRVAHKRRQDRAHPSVVDALQTRVWSTEGWEKEEDSTDDECSIAEQGGHQGAPTDGQPQDDGQAVASGSTSRPPLPHQSRSTSMSAETHQGAATASPADEDQANASKTSAQKKPKRSKTIATRPREYYAIDECAICLSNFESGEVVRILPCGHVFHKDEIDSWLKGWKKLCPTCKADITVPPPHRHPVKPRAQAPTAGATETTPLLGATRTTTPATEAVGMEEDGADVQADAGRD